MKKIAICGSMDFFKEMSDLGAHLHDRGFYVFLPAEEEVKVDFTHISDELLARVKNTFIDEHLRKIRESDAILVVNLTKKGIAGYVGANTLMEIAFAYALGKKVFMFYRPGEQSCRPELFGIMPIFLDGDVGQVNL